jgi:membrane associated rhomboid family serine protease
VRVRLLFWFLFFIRIFRVPAWAVLLWWFLWQLVSGLPQLMTVNPEVSGGVAVWAHIGGFVAGVVLVKLFVNNDLHRRRLAMNEARDAFV